MFPHASHLVRFGIPALAVAVAIAFVAFAFASAQATEERRAAVRAALGVMGLFALSAALASAGVLADLSRRPPPLMPLVMGTLVLTLVTALSPLGTRIATRVPLFAIVAAQGFRFPLELVMRRAAHEGVMPKFMSFEGYNFDVVTGMTALILALLVYTGRATRGLVLAWNVLGSALLFNVVAIAIAGMPFIAAFGPDDVNVWVLYFPYVWLPMILVPAALFFHVVVFRALGQFAKNARTSAARRTASARPSAIS